MSTTTEQSTWGSTLEQMIPHPEALRTAIHSSFASRLPETSDLLVYGLGDGEILVDLAKRSPGYSFTGVDPFESNTELVTKRLQDHKISNLILVSTELPTNETVKFDAALVVFGFSADARENERVAKFEEIKRLLKPDASMLVVDLSGERFTLEFDFHFEALARTIFSETVFQEVEQSWIECETKHKEIIGHAGFRQIHRVWQNLCFKAWIATAN